MSSNNMEKTFDEVSKDMGKLSHEDKEGQHKVMKEGEDLVPGIIEEGKAMGLEHRQCSRCQTTAVVSTCGKSQCADSEKFFCEKCQDEHVCCKGLLGFTDKEMEEVQSCQNTGAPSVYSLLEEFSKAVIKNADNPDYINKKVQEMGNWIESEQMSIDFIKMVNKSDYKIYNKKGCQEIK